MIFNDENGLEIQNRARLKYMYSIYLKLYIEVHLYSGTTIEESLAQMMGSLRPIKAKASFE